MKSLLLFLFLKLFCNSYAIYYDAYSGKRVSEEYVASLDDLAADWCINNIDRCDPHEGRRVDGSCNNLDHPVYGAKHTRSLLMLPSVLETDSDITKAASGKDLPLARYLRTQLLLEGIASHNELTTLATNYILYMVSDSVSSHDSKNYVANTTICCEPAHRNDYACAPNLIPKDDFVHRYTHYKCFNMTRPLSYQSQGCIAKGNTPLERISLETPLLDLSQVYGSMELPDSYRTLINGTFKYEIINGKAWPPSVYNPLACPLNNATETRCHHAPSLSSANGLGPINMIFLLFWRQHNRIAMILAELNPCWSDQKLFYTARDINIAIATQIYYYEALPLFLGRECMLKDGIISPYCGFRDIYDKNVLPQVSQEYLYVLRMFHAWQKGSLEMYNVKGTCINTFPVVNMTGRTGLLANGNNLASLYQGFFRQATGAPIAVNPDMAERVFGGLQEVSDVFTSDLSKGRYFGFQPYIKYREYCSGKPVTCWEDLQDVMDWENILKLKKNYKNIADVELLAGVWLERIMTESYSSCTSTFYCIMKDQLLRFVKSDRFWYARSGSPNAFNLAQLLEIRKASIACVLCLFAESVTEIQPQAFLKYGPGNEITNCSNINKIDLSKWADPKCACKKTKNKH